MRPAPFAYLRPVSLEAALADLAHYGGEARPLAGGQSLIPLLNLRLAQPAALVDLRGIPGLGAVEVRAGGVLVGALVTHSEVAESPVLADLPILAAAARSIGHQAIRNLGTVGGSLAHADPAAEWPLVLALLGATAHIAGPAGLRSAPVADLIQGPFATGIGPEEILTAVEVPALPAGAGWSFQEVARQAGAFALAIVAATAKSAPDGVALAIAVGGCAPVPLVTRESLPAGADGAAIADLATRLASGLQPPADIHAGAEARRTMARTLIERAAAEAISRMGQN